VTRFLGPADFEGRITEKMALAAMERAFALEAAGRGNLVSRIDMPSTNGFLRIMPAVLDDVMGLKVMALAEGLGTRYLVLLYEAKTGELLALLDADELTRYRTGATTALAGRLMVSSPPRRLGLIGSGFEAVGELRALAALWPLEQVDVFSPTRERRERFAKTMQGELDIEVRAVASSRAAVADQDVVTLATKSSTPVIDGADLASGSVVLSIGSTRPDLREIDRQTLARAGTVVGDAPLQLAVESGDIADALESGVLTPDRMVALCELCAGRAQLHTDDDHDLRVFKSLGTAFQDLAMAQVVYQHARDHGYGTDLGEVSSIKPFAQNT
jgi:ornithine cyclodeaminase/alanine dehydrogenase-like protein (mu-crystallin family)